MNLYELNIDSNNVLLYVTILESCKTYSMVRFVGIISGNVFMSDKIQLNKQLHPDEIKEHVEAEIEYFISKYTITNMYDMYAIHIVSGPLFEMDLFLELSPIDNLSLGRYIYQQGINTISGKIDKYKMLIQMQCKAVAEPKTLISCINLESQVKQATNYLNFCKKQFQKIDKELDVPIGTLCDTVTINIAMNQ